MALIVKEGARVMSLQDGTSKMSKSAENDNSRINLLDPPDVISKKIKKCKTDLFEGLEWDNPDRPECTNLLNMYQAVTGKSREDILAECGRMSWGQFKPVLADAVVAADGFTYERSSIEAWFRQVVVREALNQLRWLGVRRRVAQLAGFDDRAQPAPMRDGGAVVRIERAVAALSPQQRAIFVLVHLEEQTVAEAAAQLGIAEGTAKSHLHRALTSLRTQLEDLR
jgi:RNA polymerase sigma factor (sigma-70 family)